MVGGEFTSNAAARGIGGTIHTQCLPITHLEMGKVWNFTGAPPSPATPTKHVTDRQYHSHCLAGTGLCTHLTGALTQLCALTSTLSSCT